MHNRIFFAVSATPHPAAVLDSTYPTPLGDTGVHQATSMHKRIYRKCESPRTVCAAISHVRETARRISGRKNFYPLNELHWGHQWDVRAAVQAIFRQWRLDRNNLVVCMPFGFTEDLTRHFFPQVTSNLHAKRVSPGQVFEILFSDCNSPFVKISEI